MNGDSKASALAALKFNCDWTQRQVITAAAAMDGGVVQSSGALDSQGP